MGRDSRTESSCDLQKVGTVGNLLKLSHVLQQSSALLPLAL